MVGYTIMSGKKKKKKTKTERKAGSLGASRFGRAPKTNRRSAGFFFYHWPGTAESSDRRARSGRFGGFNRPDVSDPR